MKKQPGLKNNPKCKTIVDEIRTALKISVEWGDILKDKTDDVWYRGAKSPHDLLPSAYWKPKANEFSSVATFRQLVSNYINTVGYGEWDYYFLARHHGIRTRLLDWSEGIMPALFFAFYGWDGKTVPCIWMIRPYVLNQIAGGEEEILIPTGDYTSMWLPPLENEKSKEDNQMPIAIYPRRANPRIHGQQGVFTVHGVDKTPINKLLESQDSKTESIARIDLVGFDKKRVRRELCYLGLHQATIYPDPDHSAKDIGYMYGWE